ncbi:MBOAT family protein [Flavobacterium sp. CYK-4]|uniref:MBOAT family O-acyltransferase n=1 Tax=Flavobacterium lotistagni TaxID=2709660 RepID=UPI00140B831B|nr:MBOAT family protein [Flavobacterium lotistagni]NHM06946.1 MBOAT family protein [Flavobacterium lotistagni]
MLFNSIHFAFFLPVVFLLYWFIAKGSVKSQNILLLLASYFFYACWDWRFLFLLIFSTSLDYYTGIKIFDATNSKQRKWWLWISVGANLGFLGVFKYYNFFAESFAQALLMVGLKANLGSLNIILPVGISFYTFHGLSYVIDLYKNKIKPERDVITYSVFVSFFPLLVAGPIERATHLLPQLIKKRAFHYAKAVDGLKQILWGLFKKMVIADNCATYANTIFGNPSEHSGSTLLLGAVFFAFQIYGDFSGYSDIALGAARLFGIDLLRNFAYPYFSRDIAEFWRRWHISLSSWFKDYLYIPLGGSHGSKWMAVRNTFIIFLFSGFWHGANWTFILWGAVHALYFMPLLLSGKNRTNIEIVASNSLLPNLKEMGQMVVTFILVSLAWIIFRSESITQTWVYFSRMCAADLFSIPYFLGIKQAAITIVFIVFMLLIEWIGRQQQYGIQSIATQWSKPFRWAFYYLITMLIFLFGAVNETFIYFQF